MREIFQCFSFLVRYFFVIYVIIFSLNISTHRGTIVIHTFNLCKVQSMDDNCGEWVECIGVASECGEQEVGVASGSWWNLWVCLVGVVVRRYILVSVLFLQQYPYFLFIQKHIFLYNFICRQHTHAASWKELERKLTLSAARIVESAAVFT